MSEYLERVARIEEDAQQRIAFRSSGSQVVLAGPGSGKTYLLTTKVAQILLDGVVRFPRKVACVTFSRQLAADLLDELQTLGVYESDRVYAGTVHSFCIAEIILPAAGLPISHQMPMPFRIASETEIMAALETALADQHKQLPSSSRDQRNIKSNIDKYRRLHFDVQNNDFNSELFAEADGYSRTALSDLNWSKCALKFGRSLLTSNPSSVDFVQVEMLALRTVRSCPSVMITLSAAYPWWFVDEYQDLSPLFHQIVTCLVQTGRVSVFAIGDPNQCIYEELQGSKPHFLRDLAEIVQRVDGNGLVTLRTNYRSAQNIIDLGDVVLNQRTGYQSRLSECGVCHVVTSANGSYEALVQRILKNLLGNSERTPLVSGQVAILSPTRRRLEEIWTDLERHHTWPVAIDKDPDYTVNFELTAWVLDTAKWCAGGNVHFHKLIPFWMQLNQAAHGIYDRWDSYMLEQRLFAVLWDLRKKDLPVYYWLKLLANKLNFASVLASYESIRPDDVEELRQLYGAVKKVRFQDQSLGEFARLDHKVYLTTLHGSKGLEFDAAIIVGIDNIWDSATVPELKSRLAYVAVTRAKTHLYLLLDASRSSLTNRIESQSEDMLNTWHYRDGKLTQKPR